MAHRYVSLRHRLLANSRAELRVVTLGPCRIWTGERNSAGYGVINIRVRRTAFYNVKGKRVRWKKIKKMLAHRVSLAEYRGVKVWQLRNVCHACDVRECIEPAHLVSKGQSANLRECVERGRHSGFENRQGQPTA